MPLIRFCGPGTKLAKRLARGDVGINQLDEACKEHDIAYAQHKEDLGKRHEADRKLIDAAWNRATAKDSSFKEKFDSWGVTNLMKAKVKLGMGKRRQNPRRSCKRGRGLKRKSRTTTRKKGRGLSRRKTGNRKTKKTTTRRKGNGVTNFNELVKQTKKALRISSPRTVHQTIKTSLSAAKKALQNKQIKKLPRVLPVAKRGGILPLIPIFAGLSALGSLAGGAAGIAKIVKETQAAKKSLAESERHNKTMEAIALGKGVYVRPYRKGLGLYLNKPAKSKN